MSVFFDGEKLCVQLARGKDYKKVLKLAEQYDSEYIASVGIYVFPPIKKIACWNLCVSTNKENCLGFGRSWLSV